MKRLQIISHSFPNRVAPYDATFVCDHANALSDKFEVNVMVPTPKSMPFTVRYKKNHSDLILPKEVTGERCYYLSLPNKNIPLLIQNSLAKNIIKCLREKSPHLIHVHFLYPSGLAIPALKRVFRCPLVLTIHGADFYHATIKPVLKELLLESLNSADAIIAVGPQLHKDILEQFPELEPKLHTICNYVDTEYFKPITHFPAITSNDSSEKAYKLLSVANLRYTKGIDILVESMKLLDSNVHVELNIIGRLNEEPQFQKEVFSNIELSGLKSIKFLGPKNRSEVIKWMSRSDGFVLPSRKEAFGISLIEAMACGLPVVSTMSGGPEVILNEDWGQLVKPEDPAQLAEAIKRMIDLKSFDAEGQHKFIKEKFGKTRYVEDYKKLYENFI